MPSLTRNLLLLLVTSCLLMPFGARANTVDLAISASSIRFSKETLIEGDTVRIYASIRNVGDTDSTAQVFFYQGQNLIGKSQAISVLADGAKDDVFVDFKLPAGSFNIRAVIQGSNPADGNPDNDVAMTPLFQVLADTDGDGVIDDEDNCAERDNEDQADMDKDGQGDVCDTDTDGDGVANVSDAYPKDPSKSKDEPIPAPKPVTPTPAPVVQPTPAPAVEARPVAVTETPVPAAEVKGETDEAPADVPEELALDLSSLGLGGTVTSPSARFQYRQVDWRTYEFTALPPLGGGAFTYAWDFGDGATSVQPVIEHVFPAAGTYTVTLATVGSDDVISTDSETLVVSFFNLGNPLLLVTIGVLLCILLGLGVLIFKLRRGEEV